MLKTLMARPGNRRTPYPTEVQRAAVQLRRQYPETPWLEAAHRADRANAAGHMFHFHLWGRVSHALRGNRGSNLAAAG